MDDSENPSLLQVHLKISKMDQLRKGTDIYVGKTDDDICPVATVLAFLAVRGQTPGLLFICHDSKPYTKDWFIPKLRSALETTGRNAKNFAGHSFCVRAATTAAERGLEDSTIKALGRWHSSAHMAYVHLSKEQLAKAAPILSAASPQ